MLWILWCYLGLSIVQVSDTQRRALVHYSYTSSSPPVNRTDAPKIESSVNTISRSSTASTSASRAASRGEFSPQTADGRKNSDSFNGTVPSKGDFADRNRANGAGRTPEGSRVVLSQGGSNASPQSDEDVKKASILIGEEEDGVHTRRVSASSKDNLPPDMLPENRSPVNPQVDIVPTQVYDYDAKTRPTDEDDKPPPKEHSDSSLRRRDDIESSRRSNPDYRDPDFERDYLPRPPARGRYDDDDDDLRRSRIRYDRRDRGRDTDDRLSKGDTRVYPDEVDGRSRTRLDDERYSPRDRYDERRRDDEDRYRERDVVRDDSRYRGDDRYPEDRLRTRSDEDRPRTRSDEDRLRTRSDEERLRTMSDEDRIRTRSDEDRRKDRIYDDRKYVDRDDKYRYSPRDERDRYRDDEYYFRGDEGRSRDEGTRRDKDYRSGELPSVDRKPLTAMRNSSVREDVRGYRESSVRDSSVAPRDRVDDRYRDDDEDRTRDEYRRRDRDEDLAPVDRRPLSRKNSSVVEDRREYSDSLERDRPRMREKTPADDRYRDDDYRRYDDRDRIEPTRVRDEYSGSRSSALVSRDELYDSRSSVDRSRDRVPSRSYDRYPDDRETRYYEDRRTDGSRRTDPADREYRTRTSDERRPDDRYPDRRDDVVLDHRSYGSDEFRREDSRSRVRPRDEEYVRRPPPDDDEYRRSRPRGDYDRPSYRDDDVRPPSRKYDRRTGDQFSDRYRPDDLDDSPPRSSQDRRRVSVSRYPEDDRLPPPKSTRRDALTGSAMTSVPSRVSDGVVERENRHRTHEDKTERPLSAQEVIEAAHRHANLPDTDSRKVFYPVFDPRGSNLTAPEIIRPSERRGTTLGSKRK